MRTYSKLKKYEISLVFLVFFDEHPFSTKHFFVVKLCKKNVKNRLQNRPTIHQKSIKIQDHNLTAFLTTKSSEHNLQKAPKEAPTGDQNATIRNQLGNEVPGGALELPRTSKRALLGLKMCFLEHKMHQNDAKVRQNRIKY